MLYPHIGKNERRYSFAPYWARGEDTTDILDYRISARTTVKNTQSPLTVNHCTKVSWPICADSWFYRNRQGVSWESTEILIQLSIDTGHWHCQDEEPGDKQLKCPPSVGWHADQVSADMSTNTQSMVLTDTGLTLRKPTLTLPSNNYFVF